MRNLIHDLDDSDEMALDRTAARIASECDPGPVSAVCESTVHALARFWGLLAEGPRQAFTDEVEAARAKFDSALMAFQFEPCRSRSDGRAKFLTLELLARLFPDDDCRIIEVRRALIEEMARFFAVDSPPPGIAPRAIACSCHADSSAVE